MTSLVLTLNESEGFPGELQGVDCDCDDDDGSDDGVTHQNDVSTTWRESEKHRNDEQSRNRLRKFRFEVQTPRNERGDRQKGKGLKNLK